MRLRHSLTSSGQIIHYSFIDEILIMIIYIVVYFYHYHYISFFSVIIYIFMFFSSFELVNLKLYFLILNLELNRL